MSLQDSQPNYPEPWNAWIASPRPRRLRLKHGYRFWVVLLAATLVIIPAVLAGLLVVEWDAHPPSQVFNSDFWSAVPFIVLPLIVLLLMFWIFSKDRRLMTYGEISIGKVTGLRFRRRSPIITYEFLDRSGRLVTTSSPDNTRSFFQGMAIPVFFNPENPEEDQVALCGSVYEVAEVRQGAKPETTI